MRGIGIVVLCVGLFFTSTVVSAESWTAACEGNFPPYNFITATGQKTGLDTELVRAVTKHLGVHLDIRIYPWKSVVHFLDRNMVDFSYQFVGKPERFEKYRMVGPHRNGKTLFAVGHDSKIRDYGVLKDLAPHTIGCVFGYAYTPEFDADQSLRKVTFPDNEKLIKALIDGKTEVIIGDFNTLAHVAKTMGVSDRIRFLPKILKEVPRYIAFPKKRKAKADRFAKGLESIRKNGRYDAIIKNWE